MNWFEKILGKKTEVIVLQQPVGDPVAELYSVADADLAEQVAARKAEEEARSAKAKRKIDKANAKLQALEEARAEKERLEAMRSAPQLYTPTDQDEIKMRGMTLEARANYLSYKTEQARKKLK